MKKVIRIEGMSCNHCKAAVEKALSALPGTTATAIPEENIAYVTTDGQVTDQQLIDAITSNTPFKVLGVE